MLCPVAARPNREFQINMARDIQMLDIGLAQPPLREKPKKYKDCELRMLFRRLWTAEVGIFLWSTGRLLVALSDTSRFFAMKL